MKVYICPICGNVVELIGNKHGVLVCCGKPMEELTANTSDGAKEKHVPVIEKKENDIIVKVGSTFHPMDVDHSIKWISLVQDRKITRIDLQPGESPEVTFPYIKGSTVYAYCDKHGLWTSEVE